METKIYEVKSSQCINIQFIDIRHAKFQALHKTYIYESQVSSTFVMTGISVAIQ